MGRLDLTVEFYVVMNKYRVLFSDDERDIAQATRKRGSATQIGTVARYNF
jgi:hypothetical protein